MKQDEDDITNFLSKYPNLSDIEGDIFNLYEKHEFNNVIFKKREFFDERLTKEEKFPTKVGDLMKHQLLLSRFFSSYTLYDQLLLVHEMGTGKTCSAIGAVETIRKQGGFKGALYLARGESLINNFINELIFTCTDGRYIPEGYDQLTELEKVHRKNKIVKDYYTTNTFEMFAKEIQNKSDEELKLRYSNLIIIIDEVHNIRIQNKDLTLNIYDIFYRFLHVVKDCKILLMSGTPMKDNVDEIASIMNLILPESEKLVTGQEFIDLYFNYIDGVYKIKSDMVENFKNFFKGRVSYLNAMTTNVDKKFVGELMGDLKYLKVVPDEMSTFQSDIYCEAYKKDKGENGEQKGVYSNSRQASLFVFPDGSYGEEGFNKYINKTPVRTVGNNKTKNTYVYKMKDSLYNELKGDNDEEKLKKIQKFSSKYAASIRNVLKASREGKCIFIYNEYVKGSGLILFSTLLSLFGFEKATGKEESSEKPRFAILTNETATNSQIRDLIMRFNQSDNMKGKIINVIMGSRKIAEGFSLQNIQIEEIHTPWFNYSETSQAIARGIRFGSHRTLIAAGIKPTLDIYQRVSISVNCDKSIKFIDLEMYEISEKKDISIKGVELLIKVSAWDCSLNYLRNNISNVKNSRECNYTDCDYECVGVSKEVIEDNIMNKDLDNSTFQLYYASSIVRKIIDDLVSYFKSKFRVDLNTIINDFSQYSKFNIITALYIMINESTQIINKYGFPSYVKEEKNIFFLVDSLSVVGTFSSDYYTEFPHLKKPVTFNQIVEPIYLSSLPEIITTTVNKLKDQTDIHKLMAQLPIEVHEMFIESSILANNKNIKQNEEQRKLILEYFSNYYAKIDGVWVSWLLYDIYDILYCLKDDIWEPCSTDYIEKIQNIKKSRQESLENNEYGYYGQFNRENGKFCIRDVKDIPSEKKHTRTSGKVCANWTKEKLVPIILNTLKIKIPSESEMKKLDIKHFNKWEKIKDLTKDEILKKLKEDKKIVTENIDEKLDKEQLLNILYWNTLNTIPMCHYLYNWFKENDLMIEDPGCGVMNKVKI